MKYVYNVIYDITQSIAKEKSSALHISHRSMQMKVFNFLYEIRTGKKGIGKFEDACEPKAYEKS